MFYKGSSVRGGAEAERRNPFQFGEPLQDFCPGPEYGTLFSRVFSLPGTVLVRSMGFLSFAGRLMIAAFFLLAGVGKLVDMPTLEVQVGAHIPCCRADWSEGPARGRPCRVAAGETSSAQN